MFKIVAIILLFTNIALADNWSGRWGLGLGAGSNNALKSEFVETNTEDSLTGSVWIKYHLSTHWQLSLDYDYMPFKGIGERAESINMMFGYRFTQGDVVPYLGLGAGSGMIKEYPVTGSSPTTYNDYSEIDLKARLGLDWLVSQSVALNLNVDYHFIDAGDDRQEEQFDLLVPTLGVTFYLNDGGATAAAAPVAAATAVVDESTGDQDGDGISDKLDRCGSTKHGAQVDINGCEVVLDTDGDGVADVMDKCADTAAGVKVSEFGCAEKQTYEVKLDVKFASGSTKLSSEYDEQLKTVAEFMKKYPATGAVIEGFTDNTGKRSSNLWFSKKRAQTVMSRLVKMGVDAKRLSSIGYGPDRPAADNATAEGRAQNRRVVAVIKTTN